MPPVSTVGIVAKPNVQRAWSLIPQLLEWLEARGIQYRLDQEAAKYARRNGLPRDEVAEGCDLLVVLGGDGTLLAAARALGGRDVPLLAVNLGGLGFLTAVPTDELFTELERALRGECRISVRRMLHCDLQRENQHVASYQALNDVVITKAALARMIDLEVRVGGHLVCAYKADGLIVSTPTGSTAYSLSAGGPIIYPTVEAFCITPICPHMLTNRPVLVPNETVIEIENLAATGAAFLTIDGQIGEPLSIHDRLICRRSEKQVRLIRPPKLMFFDVLREKLSWGER